MTSDQDGQEGLTLVAALDLASRTPSSSGSVAAVAGARPPWGPSSDRCGAATLLPPESLVPAIPGWRRQHPSWGADLIRVILRRQLPQ